jgi:FkbM family methyltransferase
MKSLVKRLMRETPYRIVRASASNRFDAVDECLRAMSERGLRPSRIVDCGANVGSFATAAAAHFPEAAVDMIEPQPACFAPLTALRRARGFGYFPVALVGPDHREDTISLAIEPGRVTTGAHISPQREGVSTQVPAATLDGVVAQHLAPADGVFLKLDLQGYELEALSGGERTLASTDVILTEVSFFVQAYEPSIARLVAFLAARNFELYDICALGGRRRDGRARQGDFIFVREGSLLSADTRWS